MLLVILYSQVLSGILVSGDRVILFVYILREGKCKFIIIYEKKKKKKRRRSYLCYNLEEKIGHLFMKLQESGAVALKGQHHLKL